MSIAFTLYRNANQSNRLNGAYPNGDEPSAVNAPTGFSAAYASDTSLNLSWTDNADNETGYEIDRSPNGTDSWSNITTTAVNATSYTDTGLTVDTTYYYRIRGLGTVNSSYATTSGTTTAPTVATPTNITAVPDDGEILLHWEADFLEHDTYDVRIDGTTTITGIQGGAYLDTAAVNSTSYDYEVRGVSSSGTSAWSSVVSATCGKIEATGTEYFVDGTSGNDSNNGLTTGTAFQTINHALSVVGAGDGISILAGTYQEEGNSSGGKHNIPISFEPHTNGTAANPIVIKPAAGAEGLVILDGNSTRYGFFMTDSAQNSISHYVFRGLRFQNTRSASIGHWDSTATSNPPIEDQSAGVIIEDCEFDTVRADDGRNVAHVAFWGSYDWVIRNCRFDDSAEDTLGRGNHCAAFQFQRACIYKCDFESQTDNGILLKDYYRKTGGVGYHGGDFFQNLFLDHESGIRVQIKGGNNDEAPYLYFARNITDSMTQSGLYYQMSDPTFTLSHEVRIIRNTFYGGNEGIRMSSSRSAVIEGNITIGASTDCNYIGFGPEGTVTYSDYNIYDNTLNINYDRFATDDTNYSSLATLQATLAADQDMLGVDNPDSNSTQSTAATTFTNAASNDWTYPGGSPALAFMADGSNAGADPSNFTIGYTP